MITQISNPSGSHLPVLAKLCSATNGNILELGSGFFSTPLLYWVSQSNGKNFRSYDTKKNWVRMVGPPVQHVKDWEKIDLLEMRWTIALVDHGDALKRKDHAILLKDQTDYLVLHDTEEQHESTYFYSEVWQHFKYRKDFKSTFPYTTVLSNTQDLDWL